MGADCMLGIDTANVHYSGSREAKTTGGDRHLVMQTFLKRDIPSRDRFGGVRVHSSHLELCIPLRAVSTVNITTTIHSVATPFKVARHRLRLQSWYVDFTERRSLPGANCFSGTVQAIPHCSRRRKRYFCAPTAFLMPTDPLTLCSESARARYLRSCRDLVLRHHRCRRFQRQAVGHWLARASVGPRVFWRAPVRRTPCSCKHRYRNASRQLWLRRRNYPLGPGKSGAAVQD
jgi:hypothetical protein